MLINRLHSRFRSMLKKATSQYFLGYALLMALPFASAQMLDDFNSETTELWEAFTGDGEARLEFVPRDGFARMQIDARDDRHNVWWAIIKRDISSQVDMQKLASPDHELRVEVRLRPSHAPRRVNIMINTQRTVDYHQHLREYDIDDTGWHTISMTTRDLDAGPGDSLFVQLGATDWGRGRYHVDVDYYKAEVVPVADAEPDLGEPLVYHPPIPALDGFSHRLAVAQDVLLNRDFPDVNFHHWQAQDGARVLTVSASQWPLLRWDLEDLNGQQAAGAGILVLTTHSLQKGGNYIAAYGEDLGVEFDKVRIFEVLGGEAGWDERKITYNSFARGRPLDELLNSQMVFDTELNPKPGGKTFITLPRPVLQRLLDGRTRGLLLRPLGAIDAAIYDTGDDDHKGALLYFNTRPE